MDRLFLDANVLFSAAYLPRNRILEFWSLPDVVLCSSRYALEEARRNLAPGPQRSRLALLAASLTFFEGAGVAPPPNIALPEKDLPILLAAIAARATHLITGDLRHFGPYCGKKLSGILILAPADYLRAEP